VAALSGCDSDTPEFTDVNFCSSGSHLAFTCYHCRGPSSSPSGYSLGLFLLAHHYFTSQVLMLLNLNGKFLLPRICRPQKRVLIELYSDKPTSAAQPGKFLFTNNNGLCYRFLTPFYNTDIPESLYDCSDHCRNRDVSLSCKL
jgi:hypothetical protein